MRQSDARCHRVGTVYAVGEVSSFPITRLRRFRRSSGLRSLVRETRLTLDDFVMPIVFVGLVPKQVAPAAGWISDALPFVHAVRYFASSLYDARPWATVLRELAWLVGLGAVFGAASRVAARRLLV